MLNVKEQPAGVRTKTRTKARLTPPPVQDALFTETIMQLWPKLLDRTAYVFVELAVKIRVKMNEISTKSSRCSINLRIEPS